MEVIANEVKYIADKQITLYIPTQNGLPSLLTERPIHRDNGQYVVGAEKPASVSTTRAFATEIIKESIKPIKGFMHENILYFDYQGLDNNVIVYLPEKEREVMISNKTVKVVCPSLLVKYGSGKIHAWAVDKPRSEINGQTELFNMPFPNFSGTGMCNGSVDVRSIDRATSWHEIYTTIEWVIFGTKFTHSNNPTTTDHKTFEQLITSKSWGNNKGFNYSILKKSNLKFKNAI